MHVISTGAALNKDIVSWVLLFADMFGFRLRNVVLCVRINHRSAAAWEIYGNILQSDMNLFSLLVCALVCVWHQPPGGCRHTLLISLWGWPFRAQLSTVSASVPSYRQMEMCINMKKMFYTNLCSGCVAKVKQFDCESVLECNSGRKCSCNPNPSSADILCYTFLFSC